MTHSSWHRAALALGLLLVAGLHLGGAPAAAPAAAAAPAHECSAGDSAQIDALQHALETDLKVIFVLDPNFELCWERVPVNGLSNATLLPFVRSLRDVFTATPEDPEGWPLEVRCLTFACRLHRL